MNVAKIIAAKRDGKTIEDQDIGRLVAGYSSHSVPDYQMSAFAMAVYFQGMTTHETAVFTRCMVDSGERLKWPSDQTIVDKHSTGGIGDKVSIALAPLLACCGVKVPKYPDAASELPVERSTKWNRSQVIERNSRSTSFAPSSMTMGVQFLARLKT